MGEWSPSHLIVAAIAVATIIGQLIVILTRLKTITERLERRIDKQDETIRQQAEMFFHALERHEERMDKRFVEVNQRIDGLRSEMNQRLSEMNTEIADVRSEVNQRLSDITMEMGKLNQMT